MNFMISCQEHKTHIFKPPCNILYIQFIFTHACTCMYTSKVHPLERSCFYYCTLCFYLRMFVPIVFFLPWRSYRTSRFVNSTVICRCSCNFILKVTFHLFIPLLKQEKKKWLCWRSLRVVSEVVFLGPKTVRGDGRCAIALAYYLYWTVLNGARNNKLIQGLKALLKLKLCDFILMFQQNIIIAESTTV